MNYDNMNVVFRIAHYPPQEKSIDSRMQQPFYESYFSEKIFALKQDKNGTIDLTDIVNRFNEYRNDHKKIASEIKLTLVQCYKKDPELEHLEHFKGLAVSAMKDLLRVVETFDLHQEGRKLAEADMENFIKCVSNQSSFNISEEDEDKLRHAGMSDSEVSTRKRLHKEWIESIKKCFLP